MKIRTAEQLFDLLASNLKWRKLEISHLKASLHTHRNSPHSRDAIIRSGVALLYAHWEGFVKYAATNYLNFISMQGIKNCDLAPSLRALVFCKMIEKSSEQGKITKLISPLNYTINDKEHRPTIPFKDIIETKSNLNYDMFQEIATITQIDLDYFKKKQIFIDSRLLAKRNAIAHGEFCPIDVATYADIHTTVIDLLDNVLTSLQNNIIQKRYINEH